MVMDQPGRFLVVIDRPGTELEELLTKAGRGVGIDILVRMPSLSLVETSRRMRVAMNSSSSARSSGPSSILRVRSVQLVATGGR
jgi:hypothetical protein